MSKNNPFKDRTKTCGINRKFELFEPKSSLRRITSRVLGAVREVRKLPGPRVVSGLHGASNHRNGTAPTCLPIPGQYQYSPMVKKKRLLKRESIWTTENY